MLQPPAYRDHPGISQSDLKDFESNIVYFYQRKILGLPFKDRQADHFDLGSLIDALLLDPAALKSYHVQTSVKATGKIKEVVDLVWQLVPSQPVGKLHEYPDEIGRAMTELQYQTNWGAATRLGKIIELGADYWEDLQLARGKHIVSLDVWNRAHAKVASLKDDAYTGLIFAMLRGELPRDVELYTQKDLYGHEEGEDTKGLLDFFLVYHTKKYIEPWDLKTSRSHQKFRQDYYGNGLARQGAYYTGLLKQNYSGYQVLPFNFLVVPTESDELAERYQMHPDDIYLYTNGGQLPDGRRIRGYREQLRDLNWHRREGCWHHRRDYYERGHNELRTLSLNEAVEETPEVVLF